MDHKPIRITYLSDFLRTVQAGSEKQLSLLLKALPQNGFKVNLISLQTSPFLTREADREFPQIQIDSLGARPEMVRSIPAMIRLFLILRKNRPDILHCIFPASNSIGTLIGRMAGIRHIVTSRRDMGFNLTRRDILKLKAANPFVSIIIANSAAVKQRAIALEDLPGSCICVIHNGIDFTLYEPIYSKASSRTPVVGIVANLNREVKRVDMFIRAAALIHQNHPEIAFRVVGDGHLRPSLEGLAKSLGLNSYFRFEGRRTDIPELLREIDIGVICSDSEGLSNAIMEYMAAGLPVIATDSGGNSELISHGESGLLVPRGDVPALAQAVSRLIDNPELAGKLGRAARRFIEKQFFISKMIQRTISVYKGLIAEA